MELEEMQTKITDLLKKINTIDLSDYENGVYFDVVKRTNPHNIANCFRSINLPEEIKHIIYTSLEYYRVLSALEIKKSLKRIDVIKNCIKLQSEQLEKSNKQPSNNNIKKKMFLAGMNFAKRGN